MDGFHVLLKRPWLFDGKFMYDGHLNTHTFTKDHKKSYFATFLGELCALSHNLYCYF